MSVHIISQADCVWTKNFLRVYTKILSTHNGRIISIHLLSSSVKPIYFFTEFMAREYIRVPRMAMDDPMIDPVDMGVLKAITLATMITTRLMVFPTAWVTGLTLPRARKATSL